MGDARRAVAEEFPGALHEIDRLPLARLRAEHGPSEGPRPSSTPAAPIPCPVGVLARGVELRVALGARNPVRLRESLDAAADWMGPPTR